MPVGQPEALKEWFYPGDNYGQEFRYSKKRAAEIALAQRERGAITSTETLLAAAAAPATAEDPKPVGETAPQAAAPSPSDEEDAVMPSSSDDAAETAEPAPAPEPAAQAPSASNDSTPTDGANGDLPKTASQLFLIGLLGVLAALVALGVRQYRRTLS
jgi:hypothetical protein